MTLWAGPSFALIHIDGQQNAYNVGAQLEYLMDESAALSIEQVASPAYDNRFLIREERTANFGIIDHPLWLRLRLRIDPAAGDAPESNRWLLELDHPYLDKIELFQRQPDGSFQRWLSGDRYPFSQRQVSSHIFVFPLDLKPAATHDIYLRIETTTSVQLPLTLWRPQAYSEYVSVVNYGLGLYYGIMAAMFFYNLFIYLSVRDTAYLYYIAYIATFTLLQMALNGLSVVYLWPNAPGWTNISIPIVSSLSGILALQFSRAFLRVHEFSPKLDTCLKLFIGLGLVSMASPAFLSPANAIKLTILSGILPITMILVSAFYGVMLRQRRAFFFLTAWLAFCIGVLLKGMVSLGVVPSNFVTVYAAQIGAVIEVILLSLALGDRINTEKAEKFSAIKRALAASEDKRQAEKQLVYQSLYDRMSGLPNRELFRRSISRYLQDIEGGPSKLAVVIMQLNHFHDINYTLGHDTGDRILKHVCAQLDEAARGWSGVLPLQFEHHEKHWIALIEGVYLGFLVRYDLEEDEQDVVWRLCQHLARPVAFEGMILDVGGRVGVSRYPEHAEDTDMLFRRALIAVRSAKQQKRNCLYYNPDIDRYSAWRLSLTGELKQAIEQDELELRFHPKVDMQSLQTVSLEALVRWNHPEKGLLTPDRFITLAEDTGIIQPLTQWVVDKAMQQCRLLADLGMDIPIAVNVSARNLMEENFAIRINETLRKFQLASDRLIVEVTESAMIEDASNSIVALESLDNMGIRISIDDFGTGYSSLSYLKRLPVKELKIDRSFVGDMLRDPDDALIVETTLTMAHKLGLKVVAEGIEDEATLNCLAGMGCDLGQGFYITKPLTGEALVDWLNETRFSARRFA